MQSNESEILESLKQKALEEIESTKPGRVVDQRKAIVTIFTDDELKKQAQDELKKYEKLIEPEGAVGRQEATRSAYLKHMSQVWKTPAIAAYLTEYYNHNYKPSEAARAGKGHQDENAQKTQIKSLVQSLFVAKNLQDTHLEKRLNRALEKLCRDNPTLEGYRKTCEKNQETQQIAAQAYKNTQP